MQMGAGHSTRGTNGAESIAGRNSLTLNDIDCAHMAVHGDVALPMIEQDRAAVEIEVTANSDDARLRRRDCCASTRCYIHALVRRARLVIEKPPQAETGAARPFDRRRKINALQVFFTPIPQRCIQYLAFCGDALQCVIIRGDVALTDGEPLLFVGVIGYFKRHGLAAS